MKEGRHDFTCGNIHASQLEQQRNQSDVPYEPKAQDTSNQDKSRAFIMVLLRIVRNAWRPSLPSWRPTPTER